jgi:hypothetical protein
VNNGISPVSLNGGSATLENVVSLFRPDDMPKDSNAYREFANIAKIQNILYNNRLQRIQGLIPKIAIGSLIANGVSRGIAAMSNAARGAVGYASSLIEVDNVTKTVFGAEGNEQINDWAKRAEAAFGLTQLQAKQYVGTMGGIFSGMGITNPEKLERMSQTMAALAGDMASFNNISIDAAFQKLQSGMTGQTRPLQELGIVANDTNLKLYAAREGLAKYADGTAVASKDMASWWKNLDQTNKTIIRYNYILEQTRHSQGDFMKPIPSFAVSLAQMRNSIGEMTGKLASGFLPVLIPIMDRVTLIAKAVGEWAKNNKELLAQKFTGLLNGVIQFGVGVVQAGKAVAAFFRGVMTGVAPVVQGLLSGFAGLAESAGGLAAMMGNIGTAVGGVIRAIWEWRGAILGVGVAVLTASTAFKAMSTIGHLSSALGVLGFGKMSLAAGRFAASLGPVGLALGAIVGLTTLAVAGMDNYRKKHEKRFADDLAKNKADAGGSYYVDKTTGRKISALEYKTGGYSNLSDWDEITDINDPRFGQFVNNKDHRTFLDAGAYYQQKGNGQIGNFLAVTSGGGKSGASAAAGADSEMDGLMKKLDELTKSLGADINKLTEQQKAEAEKQQALMRQNNNYLGEELQAQTAEMNKTEKINRSTIGAVNFNTVLAGGIA